MNYDEWEPVYRAIRDDFGYPLDADERARDDLAELVDPFDLDRLPSGGSVAIAAPGPPLESELDRVREADAVFAASTAADRLRDRGVAVDLQVTDLDKRPRTAVELTREGTPVAVHAHGDNRAAVSRIVPDCATAEVLGTTQARPRGPVRNFGGFTDGDRAAFLADHLGADRLVFPGWAFDDPSLSREKRRKIRWAERLLHWLERRRDEVFGVLDGRRGGIDTGPLPVD